MIEWWKSLKISIAGARLSHLVQQDKIWDHGSMIEHVRIVVVLLKKAFYRGDAVIVKKCITEKAFQKIKNDIEQPVDVSIYKTIIENDLETISIIDVVQGKNGRQDKFTASLKFKRNPNAVEWMFIRYGDWWVLDEMTIHKTYRNVLFKH